MHRAEQRLSNYRRKIKEQYGFVADPSLPLWENAKNALDELTTAGMTAGTVSSSKIKNLTCHYVLLNSHPPPGTGTLLGLGLNYCIKPPSSSKTSDATFERFRNDVRRLVTFAKNPPADEGYNPKMYHKSGYKFQRASIKIEKAMDDFEREFKSNRLVNHQRRKSRPNLTINQHRLMLFLRNNNHYIVIPADKNLGPVLMEREEYIQQAFKQHLGNKSNYKQLTEAEAKANLTNMRYKLNKWMFTHKESIPANERNYLAQSTKLFADKFARFRLTPKQHKQKVPVPLRPIVCTVGTFMNCWSVWLAHYLSQVKHHVKSYLRDYQQVLDETKNLQLAPNALFYTADAVSMYNNIKIDHAIYVISLWLDKLYDEGKLPEGYPLEAVKEAMKFIMKNNVFEFGNLYFLQLIGTAMGTSSACDWATIYFGVHENTCILPKHGKHLQYSRRFLDDIYGIWTGNHTDEWSSYKEDLNNFGILTWEVSDLSTSVDFLDLTLSIENGQIVSKTYQKPMNLFLYLPPLSAHPPGCIKGTIYGLINRYHAQNTYRKDYLYFVKMLYKHLLDRGWEREYMRKLIIEATTEIESRDKAGPTSSTSARDKTSDRLFLHLQYHPDDIPRREVQELYQEHCGELFQELLKIDRPTIAYSRPPNLGEFVTKAKLHQAPERTASRILGELEAGLNPA